MPQITAGYILYSEQAQPGTFGSPKGEARFDFGVEEGADYTEIATLAAKEARTYVRKLIGLEKKAPTPAGAVAPASTSQGSPPAQAQVGVTVPASTSVEGAKEAAAAAMNAADAKPRRGRPPAAEKPVEVSKPATAAPIEDWEQAAAAAPAELVKQVTDSELTDAASRKYKALGQGDETSAKIRALSKEYHGGPPKQLKDIPQEKRAEFLSRLEKLV